MVLDRERPRCEGGAPVRGVGARKRRELNRRPLGVGRGAWGVWAWGAGAPRARAGVFTELVQTLGVDGVQVEEVLALEDSDIRELPCVCERTTTHAGSG